MIRHTDQALVTWIAHEFGLSRYIRSDPLNDDGYQQLDLIGISVRAAASKLTQVS